MIRRSSRSVVLELLEDGFGRADPEVFERVVAEGYVQHNPFLRTGREGLVSLLEQLKATPDNVFRSLRVLEDDDLVVVHSEWIPAGQRRAVVDLFRVEDGLLVEHWGAVQDQPARTASGRTMVDGPTTVQDRDHTAANKALVARFVGTVLVERRLDQMGRFFAGDRCLQHSPGVADGLAALRAHLEGPAERGAGPRYDRTHRVVGEGNFVLAQSEGALGGDRAALYDLFRVEGGAIAEHWDVIQRIPRDMPHANGMF
ncbi:MAG TPA: nuclear transport factor 2 family protein [Polyangiaceae bacterium]|nr:nuclear transport factor 2 family protein [Polyangiaceae bacterium]